MQDRFKFRIFINNKIQEVFYFYKSENGVIFACTDLEDDTGFNIDGSTLMQCTGLKDKNGKLIYEKDIIRFYFDNDEIIAVVEWDNNECRFYLNTTDYFKDKYVTDYEIVKQEYEVIGNIYENAELLKE